MKRHAIIAAALFGLIIVGGPAYVLFVRESPAKTSTSQTPPVTAKTEKDEPNQNPKGIEASFDKKQYSNDDPASIWVVVNKKRPLNPIDYAPTDLTTVGGGQQLRSEAAMQFKAMLAAAKAQGLSLQPLSGYRSYSTQKAVYTREVQTNGQTVADTQSARPGTSEHQTGLAIDIGGGGCGIEDCFGGTKEGAWVAANAAQYGFIIRYTDAKQAITGYRGEPWHIRYIGTALAQEMKKQNILTLEEFFNLPAAPSY